MTTPWEAFSHRISAYFRNRRSELFRRTFPRFAEMKVCDVGGSIHFWEKMPPDLVPKRLVILNTNLGNTTHAYSGSAGGLEVVEYDGRRMPFADREFDVAVCNSVIEHVPIEHRNLLATELMRISKYYFVQTPAFGFPIEPHFVMPFMHWLPRPIALRLAFVSPWRLLSRADRSLVIDSFEEVHLLRLAELRGYFAKAEIFREKFLGLTKSYTMHGQSPSLQDQPANAPV